MRKNLICIGIIAAFIILQACSKKDTGPIATGYEGFWAGKLNVLFPDSIQFNLKLGGALDGKLRISSDGSAIDTVYGNWVVVDTLMTITTLNSYGSIGVFTAKANKDTLEGNCRPSESRLGINFFHITRKK